MPPEEPVGVLGDSLLQGEENMRGGSDALKAIRARTGLTVVLNVAAVVLSSLAMWSGLRLGATPLLVALFALCSSRLVWILVQIAVQIAAVHAAYSPGYEVAALSSPYSLLVVLRLVGGALSCASFGVAVALLVSGESSELVVIVGCSLVLVDLGLRWLLIIRADPLHWSSLLPEVEGQAWRRHRLGRSASIIRQCDIKWSIMGLMLLFAGEVRLAFGPELASVAAVGLADFLGADPRQTSLGRVLAGVRTLSRMQSLEPSPPPRGSSLSPELKQRLLTAVELQKFSTGAYTGVMLDCARNPALSLCYVARRCCYGSAASGPVEHDNCVKGHAKSFMRYLGPGSRELLAGRVSNGACTVAFFVVEEADRYIVAIRGTENVSDSLTDMLLLSEDLIPADVGLEEGEDLGKAFRGVLRCARDLAVALFEILRPGRRCYLVGHSLGASTAALTALQLRRRLGAEFVRAVCFNPMPVLDRNAIRTTSPWASEIILSIVYHHDFASTFSLRRLYRLRDRALLLERDRGILTCVTWAGAVQFLCSFLCRCLCGMSGGVSVVERRGRAANVTLLPATSQEENAAAAATVVDGCEQVEARDVEVEIRVNAAESEDRGDEDVDGEMYLAGQVVHVRPGPNGVHEDIIPSPNFLLDHVPWRLTEGLAAALGCSFDEQNRTVTETSV